MTSADMGSSGDDDEETEMPGRGSPKGGSGRTPALIVYHLFEDPTYFDDWGAKGAPFRFAVREDYLVHHHSSQHAGT